MIKAIFFDIDGTLLSYKTHRMLPSTIEAFQILKQRGVTVFISSGRPKVLFPKFPVEFDGYISVNGGYCTVGDKVLVRNPLDRDACRRWLAFVEKHDLTTMCFTENRMFINRIDPPSIALQQQLGFEMPPVASLSQLADEEVYQFIAMQPAEKDQEATLAMGKCRMPRWHPAFTDIIPDNSSKAVGIETIINHLGISREETMAFGDGGNDIEMLEYAAVGVAMGNAAENVKAHADYVTDSCEDDGIMNALLHFGVIEN